MDQLCLCQYCKCIYLSSESILGFTCKDCYIVVAASLKQIKGLRCCEKNCNNPSANYGDTNYCRDHSCWHGHRSFKEEGGYCTKCFCGKCGRVKRKFFPDTKRCECKKSNIMIFFVGHAETISRERRRCERRDQSMLASRAAVHPLRSNGNPAAQPIKSEAFDQ